MQNKAIYLAIALSLAVSAVSAAPWTYRGSLNDDGQPANGSYDLRVTLLNEHQSAAITSQITLYSVMVEDGQFAVDVDFGIDLADAPAMRLQTEVQQGGSGFVTLGEPTRFDPKASLAGVCWDTSGNAGTNASTDFLGTTDAEPLELRTQNVRSLRIEPSAELSQGKPITANVISGSFANSIKPGARGVTISGGGSWYGDPIYGQAITENEVFDHYGTIAGGYGNRVGSNDTTLTNAAFAAISGGRGNDATGEYSFIGGGSNNETQGRYGVVAGGAGNHAFGAFSVVSGGNRNCAGGAYSWAGGNEAEVRPGSEATTFDCLTVPRTADADGDEGSFLWAGDGVSTFRSTGPNQFGIRAASIFFGTTNTRSVDVPAGRFINTSSGAHLTTGGTWTNASSRTLKTAFEAIDPMAVLSKVASLPLSTWSYKESVEGRHLGPMAEDFKQIFGLGGDGKSISTVDADGIALAAIQGLNQKLESENAALKSALDAVEARLSALESER